MADEGFVPISGRRPGGYDVAHPFNVNPAGFISWTRTFHSFVFRVQTRHRRFATGPAQPVPTEIANFVGE